MEFDWEKAKMVLRKHIVANKEKISKELESLRKKSKKDLLNSFIEEITLTEEEINSAYGEALSRIKSKEDLQRIFSHLSKKSGEDISTYLRYMEGEGSLQVIRCKCGNPFAASVNGLQDDGWYKSAVDYVRQGCTVSIEDPVSLSSCSCINPEKDAIGFGNFIHKHFQPIQDEEDIVHWVEPTSGEEFSTKALYKLYTENKK